MESMMMNPMMSAECCNPMSMMSGEFTSKNCPSWFNPSMMMSSNPMSSMSCSPMMMPSMMSNPMSSMMMPSMMSNPMSSMMMPSMPFSSMPSMPFSWPSMSSAWYNPMSSMSCNPMSSPMMSHFNPMMWSNMMSSPMSGWKNEAEMRNMPVRPSNWMECWSMSEPIKMDNFGNRVFRMNLDMHLYKPEEIKVSYKAANKCVVIEACCEEKFDAKASCPMSESMLSASKGCCKRTYMREFCLPEECKIENMKCSMSFDGWLCFECVMPHISTSPMSATPSMSTSSMFPHMASCPAFFNMPHKASYGKGRMDTIPINVNIKA